MFRRRDIYLLLVVVLGGVAAWWFLIRMPGKNFQGSPLPLTADQTALRNELVSDVQTLAGDIGERNSGTIRELDGRFGFYRAIILRGGSASTSRRV